MDHERKELLAQKKAQRYSTTKTISQKASMCFRLIEEPEEIEAETEEEIE